MSLREFVQVRNELLKQQEHIKSLQEKTIRDSEVAKQKMQQAKRDMQIFGQLVKDKDEGR